MFDASRSSVFNYSNSSAGVKLSKEEYQNEQRIFKSRSKANKIENNLANVT